jgi:fructuronate reductase
MGSVPEIIARPDYDRAAVMPGVVHLGPGAFHRAHQAAAFDSLLAHDPRWGITGVSLNSADVADALNPQDGLYTLATLDNEIAYRVIGSIGRVLTGTNHSGIFGALAAPTTRIISTTITEKGYCLTGDGMLDPDHPAIAADLQTPDRPRSAIGWIALGLRERRRSGAGGVTVLSCDNLTDNGHKLGTAVRAFAKATAPDMVSWIADAVRFPNAMVDSITPATDDVLRGRVADAIGLEDVWPIQRESFTQWVIEDDFAGERPALDRVGVSFTSSVRGYEAAKLRLLNGAHSTLAYVGLGLGYATVAEAMRDDALAAFIERLMVEDIAPSLQPPPDLDLDSYIAAILARFRNPAIAHRLSQIAWDGSQKLPYRILDTIRSALAAGRPIHRLTVPIAAWIGFLRRATNRGEAVVDPLAATLLARSGSVDAVLDMTEIFGDLTAHVRFRRAVGDQLETGNWPELIRVSF